MAIWRIYPVAHQNDARWQGRKIWKEVIVRAPTAAMARLIACELDRPARPYRKGNETLCFRSGLEDEKLYWAERLDRAASNDSRDKEGVIHAVLEDGREVIPPPFEGPYQSLKPPFGTIVRQKPIPRAA